jgi:hypothetical protein
MLLPKPFHLFILAFGLLFSSQKLLAQEFKLGLQIVPSSTWFTTKADDVTTNGKFLFGFGLVADYYFTDRYAFSSGLNYATRGGEISLNDTSGVYKIGLIEIPAYFKLKTAQFDRMSYFAKFGGTFTFRTEESVDLAPEPLDENLPDRFFTPAQANFLIGAGAEYAIDGGSAVFFGIDYMIGLSDALHESNWVGKRDNYRLQGLVFNLGFMF